MAHSRTRRYSALGALAVVCTAGCVGTNTPGYIGHTDIGVDGKEAPHTVLFGYDANRRGQMARFGANGDLLDSCSEPPPDAVSALAAKLAFDAAGKVSTVAGATGEGKLTGSNETTQSVTVLAKTTAETLFLREILFRRCEARMNMPKDKEPRQVEVTALGPSPEDPSKSISKTTKMDADDAFFQQVMATYSGLSASAEREERVLLMRDLQAKLPEDDFKDEKLLKALAAAIEDPSKVADVYARAAQLAKEKEAADKKKKEEEEAKKKCEAECCKADPCTKPCCKDDGKKDSGKKDDSKKEGACSDDCKK